MGVGMLAAAGASAILLVACAGGPVAHADGRTQGTLLDGRQQGTWTGSRPDGSLEWRGEYRDDRRHGAWTRHHDNGQLQMTGRFGPHGEEGPWQFFHRNGALQCRGEYRNGRQHGPWVFGEPDGSLVHGSFLYGRRVLRWTSRGAEGMHLDDVPVGEWRTTAADGTVTLVRYPVPAGWTPVLERWPDGTVCREGFLRDGAPEGLWLSRHPSGAPRLCGEFRNGRPHGTWRAERPDGTLLATGEVDAGRPVGPWRLGDAPDAPIHLCEQRPRAPWNGQWSARDGSGEAVDDVIARWLAEIQAPVQPAPLAVETLPPVTPVPPTTPKAPEPPTDPGEFTVHERAMLELWRRYYRDGFLPRQRDAAGAYGASTGGRRLGRGDAERAGTLLGRRLPSLSLPTAEGRELALDGLRGRNVLLVVLRGFEQAVCVYCFAQVTELVPFTAHFGRCDTEVVVVYPGSRSRLEAFRAAYREECEGPPPFAMVHDPDGALVDALGIGLAGHLARPASLVVDRQGVIRAAYVAESDENIADRPPMPELLQHLEALPAAAITPPAR